MKKTLFIAFCAWALPAVATDDPRGLEALRAAAERGDAEAQVELGILYEYGFRQPDNLVPALAWYLRAAEAGKSEAARRRDALMARLNPAEVEQAKRLAPTLVAGASSANPGAPTESKDSPPATEPDPPVTKPLF